jgi:hypothetical protein
MYNILLKLIALPRRYILGVSKIIIFCVLIIVVCRYVNEISASSKEWGTS